MNDLRAFGLIGVAWTLAACGGASSTGGEPTTGASGEGHAHGHEHAGGHEHPGLPPELASFHETMRTVWHSEAGATRNGMACSNATTLKERAATVQGGAAPSGADAAQWTTNAQALVAQADALVAECGANGPAVEGKLSELHDTFHRLMELVPGSGHGHGEGHGHGH